MYQGSYLDYFLSTSRDWRYALSCWPKTSCGFCAEVRKPAFGSLKDGYSDLIRYSFSLGQILDHNFDVWTIDLQTLWRECHERASRVEVPRKCFYKISFKKYINQMRTDDLLHMICHLFAEFLSSVDQILYSWLKFGFRNYVMQYCNPQKMDIFLCAWYAENQLGR